MIRNLLKRKPKGPQYTAEERHRRGLVPMERPLIDVRCPRSMSKATTQQILLGLHLQSRTTPMGGPIR